MTSWNKHFKLERPLESKSQRKQEYGQFRKTHFVKSKQILVIFFHCSCLGPSSFFSKRKMAGFFDSLGQALKQELIKRSTPHVPHLLVVKIEDWKNPNFHFDLWPCPANPDTKWFESADFGNDSITSETLKVKTCYVDINTSNVPPQGHEDGFPQTHINSNFGLMRRSTGLGIDSQFYLLWKDITSYSEISVTVCYKITVTLETLTSYEVGWVTILTRFSKSACKTGFKNLNTHLLELSPPETWNQPLPKPKKKSKTVDKNSVLSYPTL